MKIEFSCSCGKSFATKAENAGRKATCKACGAQLTIPDQPPVELEEIEPISPADMSMEVSLGAIGTASGLLTFTFVVHGSGAAHIRVYAMDSTDRRKSGVLLMLNQEEYDGLKAIVAKADSTIQQLQRSGRMQERLEVRWD